MSIENHSPFFDPVSETGTWEDFFWNAPDDTKLHARLYNREKSPEHPVLCLSGLTRNSKDFHWLARRITNRTVIAMDFRGRGRSGYSAAETYTPFQETADVLAGLQMLGVKSADLIGTSRGGLVAMLMAAAAPGLLKSVVFNDIGPKIELEGLLAIKGYVGIPANFKSWDEAVETAQNFRAMFPGWTDADWRFHVRATYRDDDGIPVSDYDPALASGLEYISPEAEIPTMWPQFEAMKDIPMMVLHGELSKLVARSTIDEMARIHPDLKVISVPDQGHVPILTQGPHVDAVLEFVGTATD